jgi:tetratricopeptide (TPR) repeat protein
MPNSSRIAKRVLLIGWDAADWKLINTLVRQGAMPHMQQLLERGSYGNLATLQPVLSPMLWNSIGTGKRPYKHGIHGFIEPMPDGKGVRPSSSTSRSCKALWNILTQQGMTANVVGWFCSHPAEPINGICVSDMFQKLKLGGKVDAPTSWPLADDCVHPVSLRETLAGLRVHPADLGAEEILPFIPSAARIDQQRDRRLLTFAKLFAEMTSVHNAATYVMEQNDWDFTGVYLDSIDHFGHAFMQYHPPRMEHVSEADFEIYKDVIVACYRFHDLMLGRLMHLAGEETTIILCSDHGFHSDHLRPKEMPRQPAGPAIWHRDYGVVAMAGAGIKRAEQIYGATLLDIAPTVLTLLGLPAAEDMDGKPLGQAIDAESTEPLAPIASWEDVDGDAGMHPSDRRADPYAAREALRQLVELGYIEEPSQNDEQAARDAAREAKYNVARAYHDGGLVAEAASHLQELFEAYPDDLRFGVALARVYMGLRRFDEVRALAEELIVKLEQANAATADRIDRAVREIDEDRQKIITRAKQRWQRIHRQRADAEPAQANDERRAPVTSELPTSPVDDEFLDKRKRLLQEASERLHGYDVRSAPMVNLLLGRLEAMEGDFDKALECLGKAERAEPRLPGLHLQLGQTYLRMRRNEEAVLAFERAHDIDGDNALAHEGLAAALTRLHRYDDAVDHALTAVGLVHDFPRAHLRLGVTLARLELYEQAVEAFETCLKLAPLTPAAHRWLATIYGSRLQRPDRAYGHRARLREVLQQMEAGRSQETIEPAARATDTASPTPPTATAASPTTTTRRPFDPRQAITIVTGLPRSGTSMMMQMLAAGGMTPLTDDHRKPDASNPRGYFEYSKATQLGSDSSWVGKACGKVVKIVAQLIPKLPAEANGKPAHYRIVFMERDLDEVLASQQTMLSRQGRQGANLDRDRLAAVFQEQLQKVHRAIDDRDTACVVVRHANALRDPRSVAESVNRFLGGSLDVAAMAAVVDPDLYRQRSLTP